jgi:myosin heavy subunit
MAFENFPEADNPQKEVTPAAAPKKNMRTLITGLLVAALLGTWGYIIYDKSKTKDTIEQKENIIATTSTQRDELQKELEDAAMRYDMLKTLNSKKDSTISAKDKDINEKRTRIQTLLSKANATQAELSEAKTLIASLNGDIEGYKTQIEVLQGQKIQLTQEKAVVTEQRNKIQKDYDSATVVLQDRAKTIDIASTLHASNFNIVGIKEKKSGKEVTTSTAKKVDKLRISFDLDENMVTPSGTKELYVCITAPDGTPVAVDALGSGTFSTRDGVQKIFTQKLDVNYTQSKKQNVTFYWTQNSTFLTGNYKIEVFNNGFKVGEAYRPLKKGGLFS